MTDYIYKEESKKLLGIAMQLHRELGCGFKEKAYQDAFDHHQLGLLLNFGTTSLEYKFIPNRSNYK